MKKIIFQTLAIAVLLFSFLPAVFAACTSNSDCISQTTCGSNGLTYSSKCSSGECVLDSSHYWCESNCCNTECQNDYGKSGSCSGNNCVCDSCVSGGGSCSSVGCCSGFQCCADKICKTSCSSPGGSSTCPPGQICNPLKYNDFNDLVKAVINDFLMPVGITVAGLMFVIAGFVYVTSAGDPGRARTARSILIYTAVGLAVILLASGLVKVLQSALGG